MKRTCKKLLALVLAAVLLCGATGCVGKIYSAQGAQAIYNAAKAAVDAGDYEKAYLLLLHLDAQLASSEALALKNKLVCVPVTATYKTEDGTITTDFIYDERGNLTEEKTMVNKELRSTMVSRYDENNRITTSRTQYANGNFQITYYTYDAAGRKTHVLCDNSLGDKRQTVYTYNEAGRMLTQKETYNQGRGIEYENDYDPAGRLIVQTVRYDGIETTKQTYSYDDKGRILCVRYRNVTDGSSTEQWYEYDECGHLTRVQSDTSTLYFDEKNNCIRNVNENLNNDVFYTYDQYGNLTAYTSEGLSYTKEYAYDHLGNTTWWQSSRDKDEECTAQWKLVYYPNGIDEGMRNLIREVKEYEEYSVLYADQIE